MEILNSEFPLVKCDKGFYYSNQNKIKYELELKEFAVKAREIKDD